MDIGSPKYYVNRDISWLAFNGRVLEEAQDRSNLLLERLKFLAITASNLDEFFMVRVSGLMEQVAAEFSGRDPSGLAPKEQLRAIKQVVHEMSVKQCNCLNRSILPALEKEKIFFLAFADLSDAQTAYAEEYFTSTIYPVLTPMAIDQSRPFPLLNNRALHIVAELISRQDTEADSVFAVVQVPTVIPRIIPVPAVSREPENAAGTDETLFVFLEDIIKRYIDRLFIGYRVLNAHVFRVTRNSDLAIDEEEAEDLLLEIEKTIKNRKWGEPVRLEIEKTMEKSSRIFLENALDLESDDIYEISGPLDLTVWMAFYSIKGYDHLRNASLAPQPSADFIDRDIFEVIREKDIIVHHPYESFDCVIDYVKTAAADPNVLAIKQTLYRVSGDSPIVGALIQAAENGKQVTVLVELKARFDEENNILWARRLEKSGCHVVYGLVGLKTHCKICLVVRKEEDGIRRYVHLGTGNYNDSTARIYTDLGFFTSKESYARDISALFNVLTGYSANTEWNKIAVAPATLRSMFLRYIEREAENAKNGKDAAIVAKMNSLVDGEIIRSLYRASMAGVKIRLIVRGICCLKPNIPGISENISVVSIVDRFLEHSRIYYFENAGNPKIFLSSADWMPRNLDRRVEVAFPVESAELKEQMIELLNITLSDTIKLRVQQNDGTYVKLDRRGKEHIHAQLIFMEMYAARAAEAEETQKPELFRTV